ncbi:MAG TPA: DUF4231 domain-containing protein [Streptosporangiaceae bacterium]|nr:DUF4231 domain-containing protein [Streptosporangiaceae bacterium]
MAGGTSSELAGAIWDKQSVWSQAADRMKAGIERARAAALGLTIMAAVLTTLATQVASLSSAVGKALAIAAAVSVGLAPVARSRLAAVPLADWTRARSVSEGLKSEMYTYLAGAGEYRGDGRDQQLGARTQQVLTDADDLIRHTAGLGPVKRSLPHISDAGTYLTGRLDPQLDWYSMRAGTLRTKLAWVRYVLIALSALGVALAALAATLALTAAAAWVAVATTVGTAVAAYAAASRYEYQLVEYLRTAAQLERLRTGWTTGSHDTAAADAFVLGSEQVISVQNEAWMAKWADPAAAAP